MLICIAALVLICVNTGFARDFMVSFVEENYKETSIPYSNTPKIYHSIQVKSNAGPKLLVLSGENLDYRKWLRQYIAQDKTFMVNVPENENDQFISAKVYEVDVTRVHPFNGAKWAPEEKVGSRSHGVRMLHGDRHIMVLDQNTKRSNLITSVINRMGYTAMISRNGEQALRLFRTQPEKFKMIITNHEIPGMKTEQFVNSLLKIDHQIPILVETGYNNERAREAFITKFSGAGTVTVKPVVLDNLQNTIKQLVKPVKAKG
ncbi:MAG: response regulator [Desulfobacter sp.]|nr:response regulator [Desulfobacter sp.]WDP88062.1 MAG: response regulator [Desulfobacter sp.]